MSVNALNIDQVKEMMNLVAERMVASKDMLCEADRNIGDGDHGIGMAKGYEAVLGTLSSETFESVSQLFMKCGMSMMSTMGGASGAIFGSMYRGGGKAIGDAAELDGTAFAAFLKGAEEMIVKRGGAKVGDKTMLDALIPAAEAAQGATGFSEALQNAVDAAEAGKEKTKEMVATTGKAKTLGDRALGHPDPGAISVTIILKTMSEYTSGLVPA